MCPPGAGVGEPAFAGRHIGRPLRILPTESRSFRRDGEVGRANVSARMGFGEDADRAATLGGPYGSPAYRIPVITSRW